MRVDAILPAGGRLSPEFAQQAGVEVKALIELGGRTVLDRTLETLRATPSIERIVVIGPEEVAAHPASGRADAVLHAEPDRSGPDNIFRGIEWLREANGGVHAERVLIVTTDLPFLTPEAVTGFVDACPPEAGVCVPVIRREAIEARFPGTKGLFVPLRDGQFTIGCAFLVNPEGVAENRRHIDNVFAARKSRLGMARLLGPAFVARYIVGRLTLADIEKRCLQMLGCAGCAVPGCAPELAFDIDKPEEYEYAAKALGVGS